MKNWFTANYIPTTIERSEVSNRVGRTIQRISKAYRDDGVYRIIHASALKFFDGTVGYHYYRHWHSPTRFSFQGEVYPYFHHNYNRTWRNERAVEVPIIWNTVNRYQGRNVLEIGNVLSHYFPVSHTIVDKYETATGVINLDVVDLDLKMKYDLIISISTLEHVGWDERPREPGKIERAIANLQRCLAPGGNIVVTLPVGYNTEMDRLLDCGEIRFANMYYMRRLGADNWVEVDRDGIEGATYDHLLMCSNAVMIGTFENEPLLGKKSDNWRNEKGGTVQLPEARDQGS